MDLGPFFHHYLQSSPKKKWQRSRHRPPQTDQDLKRGQKWRATLVVSMGLVCLTLLIGRLWQLQVIEGQKNLQASQENSLSLSIIPAPRGIIYDRHGQVLARNEPSFRLAITYAQLPKNQTEMSQLIDQLAEIAQLTSDQVQHAIEQAEATPFLPVPFGQHLDRDSQRQLIVKVANLPGISFEQDLRRNYPYSHSLSHILGYTGAIRSEDLNNPDMADYHPGETIGQAGLEHQYEAYLHGTPGRQFSQVDALGQAQDNPSQIEPIPGNEVHLSVDAELQQHVYQVLEAAIKKYDTNGAAAVFQNPKTGEVLSLISAPGYNTNHFARGVTDAEYQQYINDRHNPLFNRAIAGTYPPGSTVKTVVAAAAIQEGLITADTIIHSPNQIKVGGSTFADWTYWLGRSGPGNINVIEALAQSTDTFFYKVGGGYEQQAGLGVDRLFRYYSQFGLGARSGIDLPGEAKGVVPNPAWKAQQFPNDPGWYVGNTYQLSIGQSYLLATPLQINVMTSAIAADGKLTKPQLVSHINSPHNQTIKQFQTTVVSDNVADKHALEVAKQGMIKGVESGIIFPLRDNPLKVAAKTGTAEFGNREIPDQYGTHSWITGYAPYDNPQVSFTILLEGGGSSTNAAEVADEILEWYHQKQAQN